MTLARRMSNLETEAAFDVLVKARTLQAEGRDIVHLELGEPDFDTPAHIIRAAEEALHKGYTHYGPSAGLPEVREAIVSNANRWRGTSYTADQVVVMPGAKPVMFFGILGLAERGTEVICPDPGFPIYHSMTKFSGAKPVSMRMAAEKGYHPDLDALKGQINDRTRLLILNSPHNPTGATMTREEVERVAEMVLRHKDMWVLSDEVYKELLYTGEHFSIASVPGMQDRTIVLDGFSKSYAMTGWRVGYGIFPRPMVQSMVRFMTNSVSCTPAHVQFAALAALKGPQDSVKQMREEFRARRDLVVAGFTRILGKQVYKPEGAFYLMPDIRPTGLTSLQFQDLALEEAGVALLDGAGFGKYGEGCVRLSYANSQANLRKAIDRLDAMVKAHKGKSEPRRAA